MPAFIQDPSEQGKNLSTLLADINSADLLKLTDYLPLLEQSLAFTLVQDLYLECDIYDQQQTLQMSEEKLLTANLAVKETLVNSLMLVSLVRYNNDECRLEQTEQVY